MDSVTMGRKHGLFPWLPAFDVTRAKVQGRQQWKGRWVLRVLFSNTALAVSTEA